ncbi:MAG: VirB4-like conjugal transfer ATPase, CD1110 family [Ruminococcus sp.]
MKKEKQREKRKSSNPIAAILAAIRNAAEKRKNVQAMQQRMHTLKNKHQDSVQTAIPYIDLFQDGICWVQDDFYTKCIQFYDINYRLATFDEKNTIFSKYCDLLNYFDTSISFQLTFENQQNDLNKMLQELDISLQQDAFDELRKEYAQMLKDQLMQGTNGRVVRKFITFGIHAENLHAARSKLNSIASEIIGMLKEIGVTGKVLTGKEWLEILYRSLNPFTEESFRFDWNDIPKYGASTKDRIAPASLKFYANKFQIGSHYGSVHYIDIIGSELPDGILDDYLSCGHLFGMNIHIQPIDQAAALKLIRMKLTDIQQMKIDEQKKAAKSGYDADILPPSLKMYEESFQNLLENLNSKNERLYTATITIRNYAENRKVLQLQQDLLTRITQKYNCKLIPLNFRQEQALMSSLPIGYNAIRINRMMPTSSIAVFMPFTTQELFQNGQATYYGVNTLSGNMIRGNRKTLHNPNGLALGKPGSGKSFSVKREIIDVFLNTTDDIIICDPESEYKELVLALGGQIIEISQSSAQYINPMDIIWDAEDEEENPIAVKSSFIISFMELIVGDKYGLSAEEKTIIDQCVREIYTRFLANRPTKEKIPVLADLLTALKDSGSLASRLSNSLEMYVTGTQAVFNHRTNVNLNNRVVCFDIKKLRGQLKKIGMLIIQEQVWGKVSLNRDHKAFTRYYIDELHLLLREQQTAEYTVEMWKRFRKWGGIPTGITQNIKDFLMSPEVENIFDNSDFIYMLDQAPGDREILAEKLHISDQQLKYITGRSQGEGLLFFGNTILPFKDHFPENTKLYQLMQTTPTEAVSSDAESAEPSAAAAP